MEHAFAKAAAAKGTRDAFIEFLADDGIVFQPGPVNGKKFWTGRERRKGLLSWEPEYADVSRAGDLGWTTGPWEFRPSGPEDKPVAFGEYFTIWKKQNDGSWKAVLDRGVSTDKSYATRLLQFPKNDEASDLKAGTNVTLLREKLMKLETDFSAAVTKKGAVNAFDAYLAEDVRMLRADLAPVLSKQRALEVISSRLGTLSWRPALADVSASGDLGYTYGTFEFKSRGVLVEHGSYVRVWKKMGRAWQIVMDVASPDPAQ
jgi:ketosteroid isomerase-like protein